MKQRLAPVTNSTSTAFGVKLQPMLRAALLVFAMVGCAASAAEEPAEDDLEASEDPLRVTAPPERRSEANVALGIPTDDSPNDDAIVDRAQYTLSYNKFLNVPNWVAWHVTREDYGSVPRRSSFYTDPKPQDAIYHVRSADFLGSGYDQGHVCPSEQRTNTVSANRATFFMANIVPQSAAANRGPWLDFERFNDQLVKGEGKDLYIVAGPIMPKGCMVHRARTSRDRCETLGQDGAVHERVAIPDAMFKIVVPVARGASPRSAKTADIIAVIVPNDTPSDARWPGPGHEVKFTGPRSRDYVRTVAEIEELTGYRLLGALGARTKDARFDVP
jgi:endonuclease G, mitochondrial